MKISELIRELEKIKVVKGDLEVYSCDYSETYFKVKPVLEEMYRQSAKNIEIVAIIEDDQND